MWCSHYERTSNGILISRRHLSLLSPEFSWKLRHFNVSERSAINAFYVIPWSPWRLHGCKSSDNFANMQKWIGIRGQRGGVIFDDASRGVSQVHSGVSAWHPNANRQSETTLWSTTWFRCGCHDHFSRQLYKKQCTTTDVVYCIILTITFFTRQNCPLCSYYPLAILSLSSYWR